MHPPPTMDPNIVAYHHARRLASPVDHPYLGPLDRYVELTGYNLRPRFWFEDGGEQLGYIRVQGHAYPFVRREQDGSSVLVGIPASHHAAIVVTDQQPLMYDWYNPATDTMHAYVIGASELCGAMECVLAPPVASLPTRRPGARIRGRARAAPVRRQAVRAAGFAIG